MVRIRGMLAQVPPHGHAENRIALGRPDGDDSPVSYELAAAPLDTGPMHDDACGTFTLRSDGTNGNAGNDGAGEPGAVCWGER